MVSFYQMLPDRFRNLIDDHPQAIDDIWRWDCSLYDVSSQWHVGIRVRSNENLGYYGPPSAKHIHAYYFWCPQAIAKLHSSATAIHPVCCGC